MKAKWLVVDHTTEKIKTDKGWTHLSSVDASNVDRLKLYKSGKRALSRLEDATAYAVYPNDDVLTRLHNTDAWARMTARLNREAREYESRENS
jgi:hypothetical protein